MDKVLCKKIIIGVKPNARSEKFFKGNHPDAYNYIKTSYPDIDFKEGLYLILNDMQEPPKCYCGKPVGFRNSVYGYNECCSPECAAKKPTRAQKISSTLLKKYGDPKYNNRAKSRETTLHRYGKENPFQVEEIKNKIKETNLKKYGVEYPSQSPIIQETLKRNTLKRYGVERVQSLERVREKIRKTYQVNYIKGHSHILGYDGENWICKCPHEKCCNCKEREYIISPDQFFARREFNIEPCTKLLTIGRGRNKDTWPEKYIKNILDGCGVKYITNIRNIISPYELDIYIPEMYIAFECNGCYWHSDDVKLPSYHRKKFKACLDKGIQLITIWEDQIINTPEIVESLIKAKLGIYKQKIYARKCIVKEIPSDICSKFLMENHIQGRTKTKVRLGLYYGQELVGVMTFNTRSALSGGKKDGWELNRFCTVRGTQIIGGAGKLLGYFERKYGPEKIISFSSNDISTGGLYRTLGFRQGATTSAYWYVHKKTYIRYHRSTFQKNNIKQFALNEKETEKEIMSRLPYYRIYDSGHIRWEKIYK